MAMNPAIGEARSDLRKGLRIMSVGKYVIGFRRVPQGVQIVRVVPGERLAFAVLIAVRGGYGTV